jgi:hypothetical protein
VEPPDDGAGVAATTMPAGPSRWRALTFVLLAVVAGAQPPFSTAATALILGTGGVLFWIGVTRAGPSRSGRLPRGARWWLRPAAALIVVESITFGLGSTEDYPTLSLLTDPWLERYPVRVVAFLGWLAAFWTLARR